MSADICLETSIAVLLLIAIKNNQGSKKKKSRTNAKKKKIIIINRNPNLSRATKLMKLLNVVALKRMLLTFTTIFNFLIGSMIIINN